MGGIVAAGVAATMPRQQVNHDLFYD